MAGGRQAGTWRAALMARVDAPVPWRFLTIAIAAGIIARLAFALLYWTHPILTRDEFEYLSLARSLAAGHGFVYDEVMRSGSFVPFGRAPGYPAFLALVGAGHGVATTVPVAVQVAQAFIGGLGVLMVGLIGHRLGGARTARAAAALVAVYPPLVWISAYVLSEALFWPIGLTLAWLFDRLVARQSSAVGLALLCGLLAGGAVLIRPALLLWLPLAGLYLLSRLRVLAVVALGCGVLLVLGPWTYRNYVHHGRLMIVASDGGVTFWTGNHPLAIGEGDMAANLVLKIDNQRLRAEHPGLTEEEMEPVYYREALAWIKANPMAWAALEFRKLFYLVVPIGPSYTVAHSARYYVASWVSYGTVLVLALPGLFALGRRLDRTPGLWMLAGSAVLVCLVFFPQERFRIPIIDPVLTIVAGAGLAARGAKHDQL